MPRRLLDFYETPPHYIAALFGEVNIQGVVFEPCAGDGAITSALKMLPGVATIHTNDIDEQRDTDYHFDATDPYPFSIDFNWLITNPPFSHELEIIQVALAYRIPNMAFLARLSFLEPTQDRATLLEKHPPTAVIVLPRYSFRLNDEGERQTDNVTCCWLIWSESVYGIYAWSKERSMAYAEQRGLL